MNFVKDLRSEAAPPVEDRAPPPLFARRAARAVFGLAAVAAVAAAAWLYAVRPTAVSAVHPVRGTMIDAVYATGTVEPTVMIPLAPRSPARLVQLLADEGQAVTRGQPLAVLEDEDLRRTIDEALAEEKYAAREHARVLQLVRKDAAPQAALDRAKADLDKAAAARARAEAQARYLTLTAPGDGAVIRRDGEVGQLVSPADTIFWLAQDRALRITAEVDEEEVGRLVPGQRVVLHADAFPGRVFEGRLQAITPKGDPVARSYRVRISLPADTPLMIGMTVETNIVVRTAPDAILVPTDAVRGARVWLNVAGRAVPRQVVVGTRAGAQTEITAGVGTGDLVIERPPAGLRQGERLRAAP